MCQIVFSCFLFLSVCSFRDQFLQNAGRFDLYIIFLRVDERSEDVVKVGCDVFSCFRKVLKFDFLFQKKNLIVRISSQIKIVLIEPVFSIWLILPTKCQS